MIGTWSKHPDQGPVLSYERQARSMNPVPATVPTLVLARAARPA